MSKTPLNSPDKTTLDAWMRQAMALAESALPQDVPVGALVVSPEGDVIGQGFNCRERDNDPLGHAELVALKQAAAHLGTWRLSDCTLVVTLEPCPMCAAAICQSRVGRVVFGADDPLYGAMGSQMDMVVLYGSGTEVMAGVMAAECRDQLHSFFQRKRF